MAFDSLRGVTVQFGGYPYHFYEVWEWDGDAWSLKTTDEISYLALPAMAFDSNRGVTVMYGGWGGGGYSDKTWEWDGNEWLLRAEGGPSPRIYHSMAYDSERGVTVMFGGEELADISDGTAYESTWEWDGETWTEFGVDGPQVLWGGAMAYDSARGVTVHYGGYGGIGGPSGDETWEWDGVQWIQRDATGPGARAGHVMAYDTGRSVCVLFGGSCGDSAKETWEWDGVEWTLRATEGPWPRNHTAMVYDSVRGVCVLYGGAEQFGDTWDGTARRGLCEMQATPARAPSRLWRTTVSTGNLFYTGEVLPIIALGHGMGRIGPCGHPKVLPSG